MSMGFEDILEFQKLSDVQFNVFDYNNHQFFPLKIFLNESNFKMDFICCMMTIIFTMYWLLTLKKRLLWLLE